MSTVANEVRACIRQDPYLRETLARDVISHAKLARWLQTTGRVGGSEHAIISALRRLEVVNMPDPMDEGRDAIRRLHLDMRSDMVAIRVEHDPRVDDRLGKLRRELGSKAAVFPGEDTVTVVVPAEVHQSALEILGRDLFEGAEEPLTLFRLYPPTGEEVDVRGVAALISHRLSVEGISIESIQMAGDEITVLVDQEDEKTVRQDLRSLMTDDES